MKSYVKNIVLVMSAGSGTRFGADRPKQYCFMKGRQVIEYALDACKMSKLTDEVVIVTSEEYADIVHGEFGFPTTVGGENRTISLFNGLKYIYENYDCEKIIIANAVCPLITEGQIDRYFGLLDEYDYVLTCWKVTSTLGKYDRTLIDREAYFQCMEPEGYDFKMLHDCYRRDYPVPYVFHQLPKDANGFLCFDYPYTMKLTYARDLKIAEILYDDVIEKKRREATLQKMNFWLSSFNPKGITDWLLRIPEYVTELAHRWEITSFSLNPNAFATCVYEADSRKYGKVILKFHSPTGRFEEELLYYKKSRGGFMAELLDYDEEYKALLIKRILPGMQVKFNADNSQIKNLFKTVSQNFVSYDPGTMSGFPTIMDEYDLNIRHASQYVFEADFRSQIEDAGKKIYDNFFAGSDLYFLHRDLHRRNLMQSTDCIRAIDPLGVIGPKEFEYCIEFIVEMRQSAFPLRTCKELFAMFSEFVDTERLTAALFVIWVHKMDEYVFCKDDNFAMASWAIKMIKTLYFDMDDSEYYGSPDLMRVLR